MTRRLMRSSIVSLLALAVLAPAAEAGKRTDPRDIWTGTWQVGSRYKDEDGRWVKQTYGEIDIKLLYHRNEAGEVVGGKRFIGFYDFSGGGRIEGKLDEPWGDTMTGHYTDATGEGKAWGTLAPNDLTFSGGYKPCWHSICAKRPWWGKLLDTEY